MATPARSTNDAIMALKRASGNTGGSVQPAPVTTQPVTPKTNTQSYSTTNNTQSNNNVVKPTITKNSDGTENWSYDYSNGGTSYMWKDGALTSVENGSVGNFQNNGYEKDNGQLASLQSGNPVQGYGTLRNLPQGMTEDQYFQQNMGMTANQYYANNATKNNVAQNNQPDPYEARFASLEKMLQDLIKGNANSNPVTPATPSVLPVEQGTAQPMGNYSDVISKYLSTMWNNSTRNKELQNVVSLWGEQ